MRRPRTQDDLDATFAPGQTPDRSRTVARQLEAWAAEGTRAGDEVNAAELLVFAAEQLTRVGDAREALRVARRAVATGEPVEPDVRCHLHHALLEAHRWLTMSVRRALGDVEEADDASEGPVVRQAAHLLVARRRVRRQLDMPTDEWDELAPSPPALGDDLPD